jgi:hypothetical protein
VRFSTAVSLHKSSLIRIRISSDFDFIQKFAKIFKFSIVLRCLSIRLVTMRMLIVRILLLCVSSA